MSTEILSRESKAGWDPNVLRNFRVLVVGAGALGQNVLLPLALSQVGQIGIVDFGTWEISNATRSPMFGTKGERERFDNAKAPVVISGLERMTSWSEYPKLTYARTHFEAIGDQHIKGFDVIVSCVDSNLTRSAIAATGKRLGKPVIEGGFDEFTATYGIYSGETGGACWMCTHPSVTLPLISASCDRKALQAAQQGTIGAVQPVAGMLGNMMANAVIELAHDRKEMVGMRVSFADIRRPKSVMARLERSPQCDGDHFSSHDIEIEQLSVRSDQTFGALIEELNGWMNDPLVALPQSYVMTEDCIECGCIVDVNAPIWTLSEHPQCDQCSDKGFPRSSLATPLSHQLLGSHLDDLSTIPIANLGISDGDVFFVHDEDGGHHAFAVSGRPSPFISLQPE